MIKFKHFTHTISDIRKTSVFLLCLLCTTLMVVSCTSYANSQILKKYRAPKFKKTGTASYYAHRFHGRKTANGEHFDMHGMTAAHKTLRFGTKLKVTNIRNGKSVIVRVNDRGPYSGGRILDVSYRAAKKLGMIKSGTAKVKLKIVP